MDDPTQYTDRLAMNFEGHETVGSQTAHLYRGWFTPPASARYRFYQSCDDHCELYMGSVPDSDLERDVTKILDIDHWNEFRRMSYTSHGGEDQTRISDWITLEAGQKYYVEANHLNGWGGQHFSTGVEIEQEVLNPAHPNNIKEVQKLSFHTEDKREMHVLTIDNPDTGNFRLQF